MTQPLRGVPGASLSMLKPRLLIVLRTLSEILSVKGYSRTYRILELCYRRKLRGRLKRKAPFQSVKCCVVPIGDVASY
jgi:hypothetical protein